MEINNQSQCTANLYLSEIHNDAIFKRLGTQNSQIDLFFAKDQIDKNINTFATIGAGEFELIGICLNNFDGFDELIASTVFAIQNEQWNIENGLIIP